MNRTTLFLVGILAAVALFIPSGAGPVSETDEVSAIPSVELQPADTANGEYALLNEHGEMELRLSNANPHVDGNGVSGNAVTLIEDVFTITYTDDRHAEVWITDESDDLRFFRGDDPDRSIERSRNSVQLAPEQTVSVGVVVDTRGEYDVENVESFTVWAELPDTAATTVTETDATDHDPIPGIALDDGTPTQTGTATARPTVDDTAETSTPTATGTRAPTETASPRSSETATAVDTTTETASPSSSETATSIDTPTETGTAPSTQTAASDSVNETSADQLPPTDSGEPADGGGAEPPEDEDSALFGLSLLAALLLAVLGLWVLMYRVSS